MKQFSVGQTVECNAHTFWMTIQDKKPNGKYSCYFGSVGKNGTFEHKKYAGEYEAKDLREYKW
jgi:hypothetical protein